MEEKEYRNQLQSVLLLTNVVRSLKVSDILRAMERAETISPIFHPSLYTRAAKKLDWQKRLVQATLQFQQEVEKIASNPKYHTGEPQ